MKRTQRNVFLAGLLALSLSACSSWGGWRNPFGGSSSNAPAATSAPATSAPAASAPAPSAPASSGTESTTEKPATNGSGTATNGQRP